MLEAEMDQKLGYSKYDYQNKVTDDSRNGYSKKTVTSSLVRLTLIFQETGKVNLSRKLSERIRLISQILKIKYCPCTPKA